MQESQLEFGWLFLFDFETKVLVIDFVETEIANHEQHLSRYYFVSFNPSLFDRNRLFTLQNLWKRRR